DIGSSFLASEINAALLYSQIEIVDEIQKRRLEIWHKYFNELKILQEKGKVILPQIPEYATVNGHLFFLECDSKKIRDNLISYLINKGIQAVFHYLPLHLSPYFVQKYDGRKLENSVKFSERIIRLPLFVDLKEDEQDYIIKTIKEFF
ncbi:MAG: DegT/DnrJ/EryC1/StrS family aminotransferase, partial [Draconibacterium sp.]|nr:DegT/DnrJ/EryC1/StrS family aminotransferase [Draconibacterium sp.]